MSLSKPAKQFNGREVAKKMNAFINRQIKVKYRCPIKDGGRVSNLILTCKNSKYLFLIQQHVIIGNNPIVTIHIEYALTLTDSIAVTN